MNTRSVYHKLPFTISTLLGKGINKCKYNKLPGELRLSSFENSLRQSPGSF